MADNSVRALADKGGGTLVKVGTVWTYPGAPMDNSGTNLRLPLEYVTDDQVREALAGGDYVAVTQNAANEPRSIRRKGKDETVVTLRATQAGTPEAGTELPPNSRPSFDAGVKVMAAADAERLAAENMRAVGRPEGAEMGRESPGTQARKEPVAQDARKGR